jgi:ferrochelatase
MEEGMHELPYDSVLVLSFGGPEKHDDVLPFLENVLRGKHVPRERMLEVAEHYYHFGGKSPINDLNRELIGALKNELATNGPDLPVYWGNRNWEPFLTGTLRQMREDGRKRALAYVTSAFSSYSGCRQYREDIARSQAEVGSDYPVVDKIRAFYNHPLFIEAVSENVAKAFDQLPTAELLFTAHSIPLSMADTSAYTRQLLESCRLVAERLGRSNWRLVYQSRSGAPGQPWLEPDVNETIRGLHEQGVKSLVLSPIGFISCHMEVLYDLDTESRRLCDELGIAMVRAATPGSHPKFISMIRELIAERMGLAPARAIGHFGANHDVCPEHCCPAPARRLTRPA